MKMKYLYSTVIALLAVLSGCTKEQDSKLDSLDIEKSYLTIDKDGGRVVASFTAKSDWVIYDPTADVKALTAQKEVADNAAKEYEASSEYTEAKAKVTPTENAIKSKQTEIDNYVDSDDYIEGEAASEEKLEKLEKELEELQKSKELLDKEFAPFKKKLSDLQSKSKSIQSNINTLNSRFPSWLSADKMSGAAGPCEVTFSAESTKATRSADVRLILENGEEQRLVVSQYVPSDVQVCTCQQIVEGADSKTYRVTGICTGIYNTTYGNWYLSDGTSEEPITIYGTLDKDGNEKNFTSLGLEVGDQVTVEGPKTTYGTTIELVNVTVIKIDKALVSVESVIPRRAEKTASEVKVRLSFKGDDLGFVNTLDWAEVTKIEKDGKFAVATVALKANEGGRREGDLVFTSTLTTKNGVQKTEMPVTIRQKGGIVEATVSEFLDASVGSTIYRLSGFVTNRTDIAGHKFDLVNYGNFDLTDATGNVYVYGIGAKGDIAALGVKEHDIITITGTRADFKGTPQVAGGQHVSHKSVTPTRAADVAALADDNAKDPANYICLTGKVTNGTAIAGHKFDLNTYGNFDLVDESGSIYVYGVSTGWNGETKKFSTLGVKEGDTITIVAYKTSYKGEPQVVGMYVSHESTIE